MSNQYENDFYAWTNTQAALLRAGNFVQADIKHIVEAAIETDLPETRFPRACPFSFEQALGDVYWPGEAG